MVFGRKKKEEFKKVENKQEFVEENPLKELAKETAVEETKESVDEEEVFEVVKELPIQKVRRTKAEDGTVITYITIAYCDIAF